MQPTKIIWQNGKLIPWHDAKTHVLSHTLHYGGGAFEGIRFYETENGPAIFRLWDHIERFYYSANALKMQLPYSKDEIYSAIIDIVALNQLKAGYIRPIAFYGYGKMGVNPMGSPLEVVIACWLWNAYLPHETVDVKTSSYIRIHPDSTIVDAKLCGHYVNGVLASVELHGTPYHEALFLDSKGFISEGVGENFFMIKQGILYTPKIGTILTGITRNTIIQLASKMELEVIEKDITIKEAYDADEAFFTGTAAEVTPIRSIDDKMIGSQPIGKMTRIIQTNYLDIVRGKNPSFKNYLTYLEAEPSLASHA